nr:hypothetical protein Q903MT_gene1163 [Picea sitchensis]
MRNVLRNELLEGRLNYSLPTELLPERSYQIPERSYQSKQEPARPFVHEDKLNYFH